MSDDAALKQALKQTLSQRPQSRRDALKRDVVLDALFHRQCRHGAKPRLKVIDGGKSQRGNDDGQ
jgi:hypothetical protein